jgi:phospholipid/cholesterol/gamma-HCH transport system permease protein
MTEQANFNFEESAEHGSVLRLNGNYTINMIGDLDDRLRAIEHPVNALILSDVRQVDTIGAWLIERTARQHNAQIIGAKGDASRLLQRVSEQQIEKIPKPFNPLPIKRILTEIGEAVTSSLQTMVAFLAFIGQVVLSFIVVLLNPRRLRLNALVMRFEFVGIRALGIIGLMSFLIGIVIAQQGAVQLRQFGAEVFTINLIGRLTFRELGVLMTAIMIAGRSGSAFAAQIGTMKITEEIDAMRTIGVSPIEALVLPRTLATILWMPLLGFYASIMAIIGGGLLCWVVLEIPPNTFIQRLREVTPITDFYVGLIKAPVFGAIVALCGCFQGLQVKNNAEEVGMKTTAAVVQAIFLVIVLDAFFAVFFSSIGWD